MCDCNKMKNEGLVNLTNFIKLLKLDYYMVLYYNRGMEQQPFNISTPKSSKVDSHPIENNSLRRGKLVNYCLLPRALYMELT